MSTSLCPVVHSKARSKCHVVIQISWWGPGSRHWTVDIVGEGSTLLGSLHTDYGEGNRAVSALTNRPFGLELKHNITPPRLPPG